MDWREQLREASFRGVAFRVREADHDFGRRLEVHEYPYRDKPFAEDMGRQARRFQIDAYVLGDGYLAARDALVAALEAAGSGTLVHPTMGTRTVVCDGGSVRESTQDGGMAVFRLSFVETEDAAAPAAATDTGEAVDQTATAAADAADNALTGGFDVGRWPAFVAETAEQLVGQAMDLIENVTAPLTGAGDALFDLSRRLGAVRSQITGLVRAPLDLALAIRGVIGSVRALAASPRLAFLALVQVARFAGGDDVAPSASPARLAQRGNSALLADLVRRHAAAEAARAVAEMTFASYQDAVAARDELAGVVDELALSAADSGDDAAWLALENLRFAVVRDITARGGSLARLVQHAPGVTAPALVIAHGLYGDAGRDLEIVRRNRIRHPGFVAGGQVLEVLGDG